MRRYEIPIFKELILPAMLRRLFLLLTVFAFGLNTQAQELKFTLSGGYDDFYDAYHGGLGFWLDGTMMTLDFGFGDEVTTMGVDADFRAFTLSSNVYLTLGLGGAVALYSNLAPAGSNDLIFKGSAGLYVHGVLLKYSRGRVFPNEFSPAPDDWMNYFGIVVVF